MAHPQQNDDDAILSDIHVGSETGDTLYALRYRTAGSATDADGDLDPPRRRTLLVEHARATPLADVGLQVWRGALVVCDWLLAEDAARPWRGATIAELGGGVGAVSCLAAALGATALCTDGHRGAVADAGGDGGLDASLRPRHAHVQGLRDGGARQQGGGGVAGDLRGWPRISRSRAASGS